jgi:glycosyltransferase involved in cell wall biosynthesis
MRHREPRIVVVAHTAAMGGAEVMLARVAPKVVGAGLADLRVLLAERGPLEQRLVDAGVPCAQICTATGTVQVDRHRLVTLEGVAAGVTAARDSWRLRTTLSEIRPDVVVGWTLKSGVLARAATWPRVPMLWMAHDHPGTFPPLARGAVGLLARSVDGVIATSTSTAGALTTRRPVLVVQPPGLDALPTRAETHSPSPIRFLMLGRLAAWKGQHVAIEAFARATSGLDSGVAELRVVGAPLFGSEAYAAGLGAQVRRLGVADRVRLVGEVEDPTTELEAADVVVHASLQPEAFGMVVLEAMQAGAAVIAADDAGPAELVRDGDTGVLVAPGSVEGLCHAMQRLVADPALRHRMGEAARKATADRTPDRSAREWVDAVIRLSGSSPTLDPAP